MELTQEQWAARWKEAKEKAKAIRNEHMIVLKRTCFACPEQYDAFLDNLEGAKVGYLRLRWGTFRVDFPDCGGETIYETNLGDGWSGVFNDDERDYYLRFAVDAIERRIKFGPVPQDKPAAPDVKYQVIQEIIATDDFDDEEDK